MGRLVHHPNLLHGMHHAGLVHHTPQRRVVARQPSARRGTVLVRPVPVTHDQQRPARRDPAGEAGVQLVLWDRRVSVMRCHQVELAIRGPRGQVALHPIAR
ncbi:hypothetical protein GCM10025872_35100 [Barrientosiimonas endolithica]|uniref:Uncharacterized protein n=1 Tax=Barrientosiimonas endolithica TaxID=1535208 RepID=A0ABM8HFP9_9MICO|nr:hypothetical protein GCM10025872_35100 [Barrientosiimonas endolithica]